MKIEERIKTLTPEEIEQYKELIEECMKREIENKKNNQNFANTLYSLTNTSKEFNNSSKEYYDLTNKCLNIINKTKEKVGITSAYLEKNSKKPIIQ